MVLAVSWLFQEALKAPQNLYWWSSIEKKSRPGERTIRRPSTVRGSLLAIARDASRESSKFPYNEERSFASLYFWNFPKYKHSLVEQASTIYDAV